MIESVNLFDGHIPYYKITKPIRLIELFAGIGSQHQALKNLGVKIDRSTIVEWQVNSIQAYNDIHIRKYDDWTQGITKEELAYRLNQLGVSIDYNEPVKLESLMRKSEDWLRNVYNNIINTDNKVNIMSVKGSHLNIVDTDKYDYVLTYSFPCQDLSKAGLRKGMSDKTTRSGLLWEVERILSECKELPQILLMENVPDVIGSRFISDFQRWEERLRELGYSNHTEILNSKDFGIPQNRERAFMVSILGSSLYKFPQKQPLTLRLKDMLEANVDEKYYLSDTTIERISQWKAQQDPFNTMEKTNKLGISPTLTARGAGEDHSGMILVKEEVATLDEYNGTIKQDGVIGTIKQDGVIGTIKASYNKQGHGHSVIEPRLDVVGNVQANGRENGNIYNSDGLSPTLLARDYKDPKKITEPKVSVIGNYSPSNHNASSIVDSNGIAPTVMENHGTITAIAIPEDTKLGYALAYEGDGIYTNRPEQKRGVVQKQMIQTIKANSNDLGVVVYDDYNSTIRKDQDTIGTLTTNIGNDAPRNGYKLIENQLRIRKLTPLECYRLMGFSDEAFALAQANQSNSSLYHQAGDSIVVNVLMELFRGLL
jgi:DNA (cytosine-5)-methyltransferase 1